MSKQVLVIDSDSSKKFKFKNSNFVLVDENNKIILQHSLHKIFLIFVIGEFSITSVLIKNCKKYAVPIVFLNYNLKCYFSIALDNRGNFLLRKKQYVSLNDLNIAKNLVKNKISNQLFLMQSLRYKSVKEQSFIKKMKQLIIQADLSSTGQELLGIEGNASKLFFEVYFKNMNFIGRKPRCKQDVYNVLLDIGYTYLFNFIEANLDLYGFDTYRGVYHKLFFQRKSLVCDIIEPFRCIIDKQLRKSYNLKQIDENDFGFKNSQYFLKINANKKYSKLFLKTILDYKEEIFLYIQSYYRSFIKEKTVDEFPIFLIGEL